MKESTATQIDFADVRIELGEINNDADACQLEQQRASQPRPPANIRLSTQNKEVLLTSSDIFKMVKIDEPVRKSKPVKLPTIKIKKSKENSPLRDSQGQGQVA
mmetsp:Transcript_2660/g.3675  ORF Transcript_2660/g.3675 Transcript_2660/m.3675 type:complete len:103 (-) Transcript_2660:268-576(-)